MSFSNKNPEFPLLKIQPLDQSTFNRIQDLMHRKNQLIDKEKRGFFQGQLLVLLKRHEFSLHKTLDGIEEELEMFKDLQTPQSSSLKTVLAKAREESITKEDESDPDNPENIETKF